MLIQRPQRQITVLGQALRQASSAGAVTSAKPAADRKTAAKRKPATLTCSAGTSPDPLHPLSQFSCAT